MGGLTAREQPAWGPPDRDLSGFPTVAIGADVPIFRAHRVGRTPWWFGCDGSGRFDLPAPRGTCYAALDLATAVRERLGSAGRLGVIGQIEAVGFEVAELRLPKPRLLADLTDARAAGLGVTREVSVLTPYAVSQAWAAALAEAYDGIRYQSRFTTGRDQWAIALFGASDAREWPVERTVPGLVACEQVGIEVLATSPPTSRLELRRPPPRE